MKLELRSILIFGDFTWKEFFSCLYDKFFDTDVLGRAAQVAFFFSFSLFPLLFFLISLFGLVLESTDDLRREILNYLRQIMPSSAFDLVRTTLNEIVEGSTGGKLTFGLLVALWSASIGMDSIRDSLNAVYELSERRRWWTLKLKSLGYTFLSVILLVFALGIVFYGWQLVQIAMAEVGIQVYSRIILGIIQWAAIIIVMLLACELVYNLLPDHRTRRWEIISFGAIVAIVLWILLTGGFRLYLTYFNTYNRTYGSLGAVIILMLWLYLTSIVLLLGGVINSVLRQLNAKPEQDDDIVLETEVEA